MEKNRLDDKDIREYGLVKENSMRLDNISTMPIRKFGVELNKEAL